MKRISRLSPLALWVLCACPVDGYVRVEADVQDGSPLVDVHQIVIFTTADSDIFIPDDLQDDPIDFPTEFTLSRDFEAEKEVTYVATGYDASDAPVVEGEVAIPWDLGQAVATTLCLRPLGADPGACSRIE